LGIWAVKGTIALRNILLGVETVLSILYCYRFFKTNTQKIPLKNWIPIIMVGMMFCWVIFHYLFLSKYPDIQLLELKTTWFRSVLASIVGLGTGIAILRRPNSFSLLWLGIVTSFLYLITQNIFLRMSENQINVYEYADYIYRGKINAVLMGIILLSGLLGGTLDRFKKLNFSQKCFLLFLCAQAFFLVLYAYVYVLNTRNGIGLIFILVGIFSFNALTFMTQAGIRNLEFRRIAPIIFLVLLLITLLGVFSKQQTKINSGWSSMIDDVIVASQIHSVPNWQNINAMGYPTHQSGDKVKENTYERVAWGVAGATIFIPQNPFGIGVLKGVFGKILMEYNPEADIRTRSTHSAWIDLTLAYGFPSLLFLFGSLLFILILSYSINRQFRYMPALLSSQIIFAYLVGELSSQHSIEILVFFIAILTTLLFPEPLDQSLRQNKGSV
jgi:hypothetical protein